MLASFVNGPYILSLIWRHKCIKLLLARTTVWKIDPKFVHWSAKHKRHKLGANSNRNHKRSMHNAVMCKLSLYDVIGITRHLHIKLKSFSNIAQPLHKEAVRGCPFLCIIAKKSGIMSEAFLVDVSICGRKSPLDIFRPVYTTCNLWWPLSNFQRCTRQLAFGTKHYHFLT